MGVEDGAARVAYWLSFNRTDMVVKYGKGYHMVETTLLTHDSWAGIQQDPRYSHLKVPPLPPLPARTLETRFARGGRRHDPLRSCFRRA